ncbi:MAG: ABC transporter ATP-binding protein, partial [Polyangiales bacterium]
RDGSGRRARVFVDARASSRSGGRVNPATLRAEKLVVRLGRHVALREVDVTLSTGELVGLVGPNGSGKSTLLSTLLGGLRATSGRLTLDNRAMAEISPMDRARVVTMVGHRVATDFPMTSRELVSLGRLPHGPSADDDATVEAALRETDTDHLADRAIATLSAGELQRVHLARAFAQQASLLLLDEPTANLDPRHQLEAFARIADFVARGGGAIVASHDLGAVARSCTRVVALKDGVVCADGPPSEVFTEALIASVLETEARIRRDDRGRIEEITLIAPIRKNTPQSKTKERSR